MENKKINKVWDPDEMRAYTFWYILLCEYHKRPLDLGQQEAQLRLLAEYNAYRPLNRDTKLKMAISWPPIVQFKKCKKFQKPQNKNTL